MLLEDLERKVCASLSVLRKPHATKRTSAQSFQNTKVLESGDAGQLGTLVRGGNQRRDVNLGLRLEQTRHNNLQKFSP